MLFFFQAHAATAAHQPLDARNALDRAGRRQCLPATAWFPAHAVAAKALHQRMCNAAQPQHTQEIQRTKSSQRVFLRLLLILWLYSKMHVVQKGAILRSHLNSDCHCLARAACAFKLI